MGNGKPNPDDYGAGGKGGGKKKGGMRGKLKSPFYPNPLLPEGFDPSRGRVTPDAEGVPRWTPTPPRYQKGMQWEPANWSPAEIWELQQALMASGYGENLTAKVWDEKSANAFKRVLVAANTQGVPFEEILQAGVESEEARATAAAETERGPLQIALDSPEDLAAYANNVSQELVGRGATPEEQMLFAADYQNRQRLAQTDAYNRGLEPGEFTDLPSPDVAAEAFIRERDPVGVAGYGAMQALNVWQDILASPAPRLGNSARP